MWYKDNSPTCGCPTSPGPPYRRNPPTADLTLIKQQKQQSRPAGGESGNAAGRPRGGGDKTGRAAGLRRYRTATARFGAPRCIFLAEKQRKQRGRPRRRRLAQGTSGNNPAGSAAT
jgi:hypothetical protein